jgi:hypothetical protein
VTDGKLGELPMFLVFNSGAESHQQSHSFLLFILLFAFSPVLLLFLAELVAMG